MKYSDVIIENFLDTLRCPVCGEAMSPSENRKSLLCNGAKRHCFDIAAKGYINLALNHSGSGDSKEAVRSRSAFLNKGFYRQFADEICKLLSKYLKSGALVVDAGCGEGYYTSIVSESCGVRAIGFDLSKAAIESAASSAARRGLSKVAYSVGGIFSMPIKDNSADAVINLFAPCAEEEFCRVLKSGGILLVAGAGEDHLFGLKSAIYENPYKNELRADLPKNMKKLESITVKYEIELSSAEDKMNLFSMTPYYYRTSKEDAEKIKNDDALSTEVEFTIDIYQK